MRWRRGLPVLLIALLVGWLGHPAPSVVGEVQDPLWAGRAQGDVFEQLRGEYLSEVEPALREHCYSCHSRDAMAKDRPALAWKLDFVDELVTEDIRAGTASLDLTDGFPFGGPSGVELGAQAALLAAVEGSLRDRTMPPKRFTAAHPRSWMVQEDRQLVIDWAARATERLTGRPSGKGDVTEDLRAACGSCHGPERHVAGIDITDIAALQREGILVPGDAEASPLYTSVAAGTMPPAGAMDPEVVERLRQWIEGSEELQIRPASPRSLLLTEAARDLARLPRGARPWIRYMSGEHLDSVRASPAARAAMDDAVRLVASSLSRTPETARVTLVSEQPHLLRVDFGPTGLSPEELLRVDEAYPLNWVPQGAEQASEALREVAGVDVMAADWFLYMVTQAPLYTGLTRTPRALEELAEGAGATLCDPLAGAQRAATTESGVSRYHRVVERWPTSIGAFWISWDFGRGGGSADVLRSPMGPECTGLSPAFDQDGNEVILSLPNGLFHYALYNGEGSRLDLEAPLDIVQDEGGDPIVNALSCMGCHFSGLRPVRLPVAPSGQSPHVKQLYPGTLDALLELDNEEYRAALLRAGVSPLHSSSPVSRFGAAFDRNQDLDQVAALLGLSPEQVRVAARQLGVSSPLQPLGIGESVPMASLLEGFSALIRGGDFGRPIPATQPVPFADRDRLAQLQDRRARSSTLDYSLTEEVVDRLPLLMGEHEVRVVDWLTVTGSAPGVSCLTTLLVDSPLDNEKLRQPEHPAVCVGFEEVLRFANTLSRRDGLQPAYLIRDEDVSLVPGATGYRLPTSAEWAAVAGPAPEPASACAEGNVRTVEDARLLGLPIEGAFPCEDGYVGLAPADRLPGLLDLWGNAGEWV